MERPIGISQEFPGKKDRVGLAGGDDLLRLHGFGYQAHCACRDSDLLTDGRGKGSLVAGSRRDFGIRNQPAAGAIDKVHPGFFQPAAEIDGLRKVPPILHPVGAGDADEEGKGVRPGTPYRFGCLKGEPEAILQGAAVPILPVVG